MSGTFDLTVFLDGYYDQDCYFHLPTHYLPNLTDPWFLDRFRVNTYVLATGWDDQCLAQNQDLDRILNEKGIPHRIPYLGFAELTRLAHLAAHGAALFVKAGNTWHRFSDIVWNRLRRKFAMSQAQPLRKFLDGRPLETISGLDRRHDRRVSRNHRPAESGVPPAPGKWSAAEIVCHLADCELVFGFRLRQTLAEDWAYHSALRPGQVGRELLRQFRPRRRLRRSPRCASGICS